MPTVDFTLNDLKEVFATKGDLTVFASKDDLQRFATKNDLQRFATKEDLQQFPIKDDLQDFARKSDLQVFATKDDVRATVNGVREEIRGLRKMLEEDALAESRRLDRVEKRTIMTQRLLEEHLADVRRGMHE